MVHYPLVIRLPHAMKTHRPFSCLLLCALLLAVAGPQAAQAQRQALTTIDTVYPYALEVDGFVLKQPQEVVVEATGPTDRGGRRGLSNAWILDAETREVVWELERSPYREAGRHLRETKGTLTLPAGAYEVYYAAFPVAHLDHDGWDDWEDVRLSDLGDIVREAVGEIFGRDRYRGERDWRRFDRDDVARFGITVRGQRDAYTERDRARLTAAFDRDTVVGLTQLGDDEYVHAGFALSAPTTVEVYALGEVMRGSAYDYGWIVDLDTRERVWTMDYHNTVHAGGAQKNRMAREVLTLPAGRYGAFFATDDSHGPESWNAAPPYDALSWGLRVRVTDPAARRAVQRIDVTPVRREEAIVDLSRMRDDDYRSAGFTLRRPMNVHVYAVGEGRNGNMYDYGWILDADTRERVWEMTYYDTEHAGGADKNRVFDGIVQLPAGRYTAHFVTDDSHAYGDWNSGTPYDPQAWGLVVAPAGADFDADAVAPYDPRRDAKVVAQLLRMRDDARERTRFSLDAETRLHVYALGEGSDGRMYDYGWIENARTGRVVWEMTYRMTDHAGGARKNRAVDTVLTLPAGDYTLHYRSDGSHAFGDWNSAPPHDAEAWGILLRQTR